MTNFQVQTEALLNRIDPQILREEISEQDAALYAYEANYAAQRELKNTAIALPLVRYLTAHAAESEASRFHVAAAHAAYFRHAMMVTQMLIDLHIPLPPEEEDWLLSAAICHILPENIEMPHLEEDLLHWQLAPETAQIVRTVFWEDNSSGSKQRSYYDRIQTNKLALMLKLADRSNLVEQLYGISGWTARSHIQETKAFFFPMCVYAKEWYPELIAPISVMMEKMRCLMEVAEILLSRYEAREASLSHEILELQEENATLRGFIHALTGADM